MIIGGGCPERGRGSGGDVNQQPSQVKRALQIKSYCIWGGGGGGGGGAIFESKTLSLFIKKKMNNGKKKLSVPDWIWTHDLRVRKPAPLFTRLNTIALTKLQSQNIQMAITQNISEEFCFKFSPDNLLIVLYQLIKVSSL